jgi:uncharacterized membrane protein YkoI
MTGGQDSSRPEELPPGDRDPNRGEEMNKRAKLLFGTAVAVAVVGAGAGVGIASGGDNDTPLSGNAYDRATAAALEYVGGGAVTETEAGEGGAAYEVGIRLDDGREVEVQLSEDFDVITSEGDDEGAGDLDDGGGDA